MTSVGQGVGQVSGQKKTRLRLQELWGCWSVLTKVLFEGTWGETHDFLKSKHGRVLGIRFFTNVFQRLGEKQLWGKRSVWGFVLPHAIRLKVICARNAFENCTLKCTHRHAVGRWKQEAMLVRRGHGA